MICGDDLGGGKGDNLRKNDRSEKLKCQTRQEWQKVIESKKLKCQTR